MTVKLIQAFNGQNPGDTYEGSDEDCQKLIDLKIAEPVDESADDAAETASVEKAFIAKNEKALEAKAKSIKSDFEIQMKALKETVERQTRELENLKMKSPAPDIGVAQGKQDNKFGFKSHADYMGHFVCSGLGKPDSVAKIKSYKLAFSEKYKNKLSTKAATLNIADDTSFVPPDFQDVYEPTFGSPFLYKEATLWQTDSGSSYIPFIKDLDHTASIGGVTTTDLDPDDDVAIDIEESKLGNGTKLVGLKLFGELCPISEHMQRWSPYNMGVYTSSWMKKAAEFKLEDWFNNHASFGWRTAANGTLNKVTRKTANRIQHTDILNMKAAAYDPFNPNYEGFYWVITAANKSRELGRLTFIDATGTFPILLGNNSSVNNAEYPMPQTLEGIPIICSEFASALGSEGDIALVRPKSYWGLRNKNTDFNVEESIHFKFNKGGNVLRLIGEGAFSPNSSGRTKLKSGDYVSPFVVLDDVVTS